MKPSALLPDNRTLYDEDFHLWTQQTAELLRSGHFDLVNIEHLAEEVESMGASDRREALSRLGVLLLHLFKWQIQMEHRSVVVGHHYGAVARYRYSARAIAEYPPAASAASRKNL